jgi:hypothetical protein
MKNIIELDYKQHPKEVIDFVKDQIKIINRRGISVHLLNKRRVTADGSRVSGYFDDENKVMAVGVLGHHLKWLGVFVHETCHCDQWWEKDSSYFKRIKGYEPHVLYGQWIDHVVEFTPEQSDAVFHAIMDLELNNEKRSLNKIKEFDLPIDHEDYIRKANAYVLYHKALQIKRKWYDKQPWNVDGFAESLPTKWMSKKELYSPSKSMLDLMLKCCWKD